MDKFPVNIYIETSTSGTGRCKVAAGMYIIEYFLKNKTAVTCQGILIRENITGDAIALETIAGAFGRLTKTCEVLVITKCLRILNVVNNHCLPLWEKNGWLNAKRKPVANKELWQQVYKAVNTHTVSFAKDNKNNADEREKDSYESRMQFDIQKAVKAFGSGREYCPMEKYKKIPAENGWWILWK